VNAVRELTWSFKPEEWARKRCGSCRGNGWYRLDPDMSARSWNPCHVPHHRLQAPARPMEPRYQIWAGIAAGSGVVMQARA
jgi:hypothetical protein